MTVTVDMAQMKTECMLITHHRNNKMDRDIDAGKRRKKSDKSKDKKARNGNFSQKHVRIQQEMAAIAAQQRFGGNQVGT